MSSETRTTMTLAQKMITSTTAMLVSVLVITTVSLYGLRGLGQDLDVALVEYRKLGAAYDVGVDVSTVRALLGAGAVDDPEVLPRLQAAIDKLSGLSKHEDAASLAEAQTAIGTLQAVTLLVQQARREPGAGEERLEIAADGANRCNSVIEYLVDILTQTREVIQETQRAASERRQSTTLIVASLLGLMMATAVAVGVQQYRSVILPLSRLRSGVGEIAAGRFSKRLEPETDAEFAALARDFNNMASQLDSLYRELERKVQEKSKELVRSERLASVGFLAAGVAHEINNPLGIISGYAELSLKSLDQAFALGLSKDAASGAADASASVSEPDPEAEGRALAATTKALRVICDEAFRCKQITQKLLSLARRGPESVGPVSIAEVARRVSDMIAGLPKYREERLSLVLPESDELMVTGSQTQLIQVLLNLTINALEAVTPGEGSVVIEGRRVAHRIVLSVLDNGRGMTPQVLDHVFEPFFTDKRGASGGTGLGLSISHAIVSDHHGKLRAESEGPGKGSRFTMELPALEGSNS